MCTCLYLCEYTDCLKSTVTDFRSGFLIPEQGKCVYNPTCANSWTGSWSTCCIDRNTWHLWGHLNQFVMFNKWMEGIRTWVSLLIKMLTHSHKLTMYIWYVSMSAPGLLQKTSIFGHMYMDGRRYSAGKRSLGRPRRRWQDNIRMDLKEIGNNTRNWVDSAQYREYWRVLVNAAMNLRVP